MLYNSPFGFDDEIQDTIKCVDIYPTHIFSDGTGIPLTNSSFNALVTEITQIQHDEFGKKNVTFCSSGSESFEIIFNSLDFDIRKDKIFTFNNSYHGISHIFSLANKINHNQPVTSILSQIKKEKSSRYNLFIIEACIGSSGGYVFDDNFLYDLISKLKKENFIIIVDEIISGFKRLGISKYFKSAKLGEIPDFVCFSKQITNGLVPLSGILNNTDDIKTKNIGTTSTGNLITTHVALATLEKIKTTNLATVNFNLERMLAELTHKFSEISIQKEGLFAGIHFPYLNYNNNSKNAGQFIASMCDSILVRGHANGINLCPGYLFTDADFEKILTDLTNCFIKIGVK